jgi:uncharacterized tellurite resistance protein B-like protein
VRATIAEDETMSSIKVSQYGKQKYNASGSVDMAVARSYLTVLLATVGADGEISPAEMGWLIHEQRAIGAPEELLEEIQTLDWRSANVDELIGRLKYGFSVNARRTMLYQALKMARADGRLHQAERAAIDRLARTLEIDTSVSDSIYALVEMEDSIDQLRYGLLETSRNH